MNLEFRQGPRSIYGKNGTTPTTQFAMIMPLHVISTPCTQGGFILVVPIQRKRDGFSFLGHVSVGAPAVSSCTPQAREPMPTWGARLPVAIHVVGVVFEGHNDVGDRWVHGPSLIGVWCPTGRFFYTIFLATATGVNPFDSAFAGPVFYWRPSALR